MLTNHDLLSDARSFLREQVSGVDPNSELAHSWDEFFAIYDAIIRRFAIAGGVPPHEVDECVQEVWTAVVVHLDRFQPDPNRGRFRTWLFQIVRSKSTNLIRQRRRSSAMSLNDSRHDFDVPGHDEGDSAQELERSWQQESFRVLLADLKRHVSPVSYQIFRLRAVSNKSFDELARKFQMEPSAVRTRYHRTLNWFREHRRRYSDLND